MGRNPDEPTPRRSKRRESNSNQVGLVGGAILVLVIGFYGISSLFQSQPLLPPPAPEAGSPPIVGTPTATAVPTNTQGSSNTTTNGTRTERDRPSATGSKKSELQSTFGEDKVATVVVKKALGDPIAIEKYLHRKLFRAAYHDYKEAVKRAKPQASQNSEQAKDQALAHAHKQTDLGPVFVQYRYRLLNPDVPYPQVIAGSKAGGTFIYQVAPVESLEELGSRSEIGENRTIDQESRTITIEAQLPTPVPDPDVEELYLQYGSEAVAKIRVMEAQGQKDAVIYFLESQTAQLDPNVYLAVAGTRAVSPTKYELYIAPIVNVQAFAERIKYGTVAEVEPTVRMITVDATIPAELPPRPSAPELAIRRRWDWDRLWIKPVAGDSKAPEGEEFYAWFLQNIKGPHGAARSALAELKLKEVDEAHRQSVADALIATLKQSSNIPEQLEAMVKWKSDATERTIIAMVGNLNFHRHSPAIMATLVKLGSKEAARALSLGLTDSVYSEDAARSLIEIGSIAEEYVVKFADNRDDAIRTRAYEILAEIGTEKSIPKLRSSITKEKDPFMKDRVRGTVDKIKQRAEDAKAAEDPDSPFSTKPKK